MKEIAVKIYNIAFVFLAGLVMSGYGGSGGGGSLGFLGDASGGGSGLIGMAIYAKAKLKSKGKV